MTMNHIAKIAHDNNITMDEAVQRVRQAAYAFTKQWNAAAKQSKGER